MQVSAKSCCALKPNGACGHSCQHKYVTAQDCFGHGYPDGQVMPVCVSEDRQFDMRTQTISIKPRAGA